VPASYLEHLRRTNSLRPPLDAAQLRVWRGSLGDGLPPALESLYRVTNGTSGDEQLAMRLLSDEESLETADGLGDWLRGREDDKLFPFWTDDNNNYASLFLAGPLTGMVAFIDHDEVLPVPVFASADSFLAALTAGGPVDWTELARDYPRIARAPSPLGERESNLKAQYLALHEANPADDWPAHVALQFLTRSDGAVARQLLASPHMWIQERACRLAGALGMEELVDELEAIARGGTHNGRIASIVAIQKLTSERARSAVARLKATLRDGFEVYLRG
jgi:hypothetical protein